MKKVEIKISGHTYNLEFEDGFFDYVISDLEKIHKSDKQVKVMLELLLEKSYENYKKELELNKIAKKI